MMPEIRYSHIYMLLDQRKSRVHLINSKSCCLGCKKAQQCVVCVMTMMIMFTANERRLRAAAVDLTRCALISFFVPNLIIPRSEHKFMLSIC